MMMMMMMMIIIIIIITPSGTYLPRVKIIIIIIRKWRETALYGYPMSALTDN